MADASALSSSTTTTTAAGSSSSGSGSGSRRTPTGRSASGPGSPGLHSRSPRVGPSSRTTPAMGPGASTPGAGVGGGGGVVAVDLAALEAPEVEIIAAKKVDEADDSVEAWLSATPRLLEQYEKVLTVLRRREQGASITTASMILIFLRNLVGSFGKNVSTATVIKRIKQLGHELTEAQHLNLVIGNIVRRFLYIVREERHRMKRSKSATELLSMHSILESEDGQDAELARPFKELKDAVKDAVAEMAAELDNIYEPIISQAPDHIHSNEVILTFGNSTTVSRFLGAAGERGGSQRRGTSFEVIVTESAPTYAGQDMARTLAGAGITVTVINDSAVYAVMSRVHKVIIGCKAILANGGLLVHSGGYNIALAAKKHAVPVVCVSSVFKLCPVYPHDQRTFNDLVSPTPVLNFDAAASDAVTVVNPAFDYIPPDLVDLFVTNSYGLQPSYVYRLLTEMYHPEDYTL